MDSRTPSTSSASSEDHEYKEEEEQNLMDALNSTPPSREQIVQLLRRMHHEQLVELLVPFIEKEPNTYVRMVKDADSNVIFRKLFVHGLPLGTTELEFRNFFECYGPIEAVELPIPRGNTEVKYGFIIFSSVDSVHKALVNPNKWFGGKEICCKVFTVRSPVNEPLSPSTTIPLPPPPNRKIFVSGLSQDVNYNEFLAFFSQFGAVENAQIAPTKGSGFVVYAHQNSAKDAIARANRTTWGGRVLTVAWFKKRPEEDSRAVARRTPMTVPQPLSWATASHAGPQFAQAHLSTTLPSGHWFSYPVFQPDPYFFIPVPVAAADVHVGTTKPEAVDESL